MNIVEAARDIIGNSYIATVDEEGFDEAFIEYIPTAEDASSSDEYVAVLARLQQQAADKALLKLKEAAASSEEAASYYNSILAVLADEFRPLERDGILREAPVNDEADGYDEEATAEAEDQYALLNGYGADVFGHRALYRATASVSAKALEARRYFGIEDILFATNGNSKTVRQRRKRVTAAERAAAIRARRILN